MPIIFAAMAAASIASSLKGGKKKKKAARLQQALLNMQADKNRKAALREYRLARAEAISAVASSGAEDSSAQRGISGSLQSQIQTNLEMSFTEQAAGQEIAKNLEQGAKWDFVSSSLALGANIATAASPLQRAPSTQVPKPGVNASPFVKK